METNRSRLSSAPGTRASALNVSRKPIQKWRDDPRYALAIEKRKALLARADARHEETTGQASFERFAISEERARLDDTTQTERVRVGGNLKRVRRDTTY